VRCNKVVPAPPMHLYPATFSPSAELHLTGSSIVVEKASKTEGPALTSSFVKAFTALLLDNSQPEDINVGSAVQDESMIICLLGVGK